MANISSESLRIFGDGADQGREKMKQLLTSNIFNLCSNSLSAGSEMHIDCLLCVTLNKRDVVVLKINEVFFGPSQDAHYTEYGVVLSDELHKQGEVLRQHYQKVCANASGNNSTDAANNDVLLLEGCSVPAAFAVSSSTNDVQALPFDEVTIKIDPDMELVEENHEKNFSKQILSTTAFIDMLQNGDYHELIEKRKPELNNNKVTNCEDVEPDEEVPLCHIISSEQDKGANELHIRKKPSPKKLSPAKAYRVDGDVFLQPSGGKKLKVKPDAIEADSISDLKCSSQLKKARAKDPKSYIPTCPKCSATFIQNYGVKIHLIKVHRLIPDLVYNGKYRYVPGCRLRELTVEEQTGFGLKRLKKNSEGTASHASLADVPAMTESTKSNAMTDNTKSKDISPDNLGASSNTDAKKCSKTPERLQCPKCQCEARTGYNLTLHLISKHGLIPCKSKSVNGRKNIYTPGCKLRASSANDKLKFAFWKKKIVAGKEAGCSLTEPGDEITIKKRCLGYTRTSLSQIVKNEGIESKMSVVKKSNRSYACPKCSERYAQLRDIKRHLLIVHGLVQNRDDSKSVRIRFDGCALRKATANETAAMISRAGNTTPSILEKITTKESNSKDIATNTLVKEKTTKKPEATEIRSNTIVTPTSIPMKKWQRRMEKLRCPRCPRELLSGYRVTIHLISRHDLIPCDSKSAKGKKNIYTPGCTLCAATENDRLRFRVGTNSRSIADNKGDVTDLELKRYRTVAEDNASSRRCPLCAKPFSRNAGIKNHLLLMHDAVPNNSSEAYFPGCSLRTVSAEEKNKLSCKSMNTKSAPNEEYLLGAPNSALLNRMCPICHAYLSCPNIVKLHLFRIHQLVPDNRSKNGFLNPFQHGCRLRMATPDELELYAIKNKNKLSIKEKGSVDFEAESVILGRKSLKRPKGEEAKRSVVKKCTKSDLIESYIVVDSDEESSSVKRQKLMNRNESFDRNLTSIPKLKPMPITTEQPDRILIEKNIKNLSPPILKRSQAFA